MRKNSPQSDTSHKTSYEVTKTGGNSPLVKLVSTPGKRSRARGKDRNETVTLNENTAESAKVIQTQPGSENTEHFEAPQMVKAVRQEVEATAEIDANSGAATFKIVRKSIKLN